MAAAQAAENHGNEAWPDIFNEGCRYQFQPETTNKVH